MDLSKAFDTISHDLLIAKSHVFRFSKESLKLIKSYLTNRRTKLNTGFGKWTDILFFKDTTGISTWTVFV